MKICILGSTGVLGVALRKALLSKGVDFFVLSHEEVDIENFEELKSILEQEKPTHIINTVAIVGIEPCDEKPLEAFSINTLPSYLISNFCLQRDMTYVYISTHAVFDGTKEDYYYETDKPRPMNIYAGTKLLAEQFVESICDKFYIVRVPTMFGNRENNKKGFTDKVLEWLRSEKDVKVATDKIDTLSFSDDIAEQIVQMILMKYEYGTYHIANEGSCSFYEFVSEVAAILGIKKDIIKALDKDFPSKYYKPLRTPIASVRAPKLRGWKEALRNFLRE
ncbi:NAD(P)-dependent oxidoreductase [Sulfurimonas sp. HSL-1716]|uniref:SDR family oxidoreductase n=1 Tax=Hydrocurvibacter sulfurireducens TaxID=3131937 RepID=UPI0031F8075B